MQIKDCNSSKIWIIHAENARSPNLSTLRRRP